MALASRLRVTNIRTLATTAFYGIVGILFLALLPLSGFPPHIALIGITSIVAAYGLFKKRFWAIWLVAALFFVATTLALYTLYFVIASDVLATAGMLAYMILTWVFTAYAAATRRPAEA
ncbi:MAG: hypothetical protein ACE14S_08580 [Candidatus Bathyarchaeia archaeon]